jgi:hypothetical protein
MIYYGKTLFGNGPKLTAVQIVVYGLVFGQGKLAGALDK